MALAVVAQLVIFFLLAYAALGADRTLVFLFFLVAVVVVCRRRRRSILLCKLNIRLNYGVSVSCF